MELFGEISWFPSTQSENTNRRDSPIHLTTTLHIILIAMCNSFQSPRQSEVLSSALVDSLSPPPTPIAKRARRSSPSSPAPMFFPKSKSIISAAHDPSPSPSTAEKEDTEEKRVALLLASRPVPHTRLSPRPTQFGVKKTTNTFRAEDIETLIRTNQLPPLPFSSPASSTVEQLEALSLSARAKSAGSPPLAKLPSFERGGMHRRTSARRNSLVARTA